MRRLTRLLCCLLCLMLLPIAPSCAAAAGAPPTTIRVLLRRLALTDRADLVLDGLYTATGSHQAAMAFPQGAEVTVQIRDGELYLFYAGMSISAGASLTFTRQASSASSTTGLRILPNVNQYPGDLRLTIENGQLQPVLTIDVEDYLKGVVPYEMSDSFPLEALKAQAVCARTYALSRVNTTRAWDVVDTTNDQVFKGLNAADVNAARAVEETAGIVGVYNNQLATCYYGASNGGQTELPEYYWQGMAPLGYYAIQDDPYDLENPESMVLRATVSKTSPQLPEAVLSEIFTQILPELLAQGFVPSEEHFRVDTIDAAEFGNPLHGDPCRQYATLALTISWSGQRILNASSDGEISMFGSATDTYSAFAASNVRSVVYLTMLPTLLRAWRLSISGLDNEMLTVTDCGTYFSLEARRYGHGVGMSQRGAQQMAGRYGMTFDQILTFYYPGMTLMLAPSTTKPLPTPPANLFNTPGPSASPTPRPTLMPVTTTNLPADAWLASVEGIEDDSSLNLRQEPNQASIVLMRLYKHQPLIVLSVCEDPAWVHVRTDAAEGYVMVSFLERMR